MDLISIESYYRTKQNRLYIALIITFCIIFLALISISTFFIEQIISRKDVALLYIKLVEDSPIEIKQETIKKANTPQITEKGFSNIEHIYKSDEKRVFLTFDDGPSKTVTPKILDTLKSENIKATFFVLGSRVDLNPDIVKRAYEEGHYIANHGYSHKYSQIYASKEDVLEEFNKTNEAVQKAIGNSEYNSHLFRFPGGTSGGKYAKVKSEAAEYLKENGIAHVDWNALTEDSAGKDTIPEMMEELKQTIGSKNSVVILMHDAGNKELTAQMLPEVIQYLRDNGYGFRSFYDVME